MKFFDQEMNFNQEAIEEIIETNIDFPEKNRKRGERSTMDDSKALRKAHIADHIYVGGYHAPLGSLRKGKIHCSCPMCAAKTNTKINKSRGPVDESIHHKGRRQAVTNRRYGRKNYKPSDIRKVDSMICKLKEYDPSEFVFA